MNLTLWSIEARYFAGGGAAALGLFCFWLAWMAWTRRPIDHYLCGKRHRACDPCEPE